VSASQMTEVLRRTAVRAHDADTNLDKILCRAEKMDAHEYRRWIGWFLLDVGTANRSRVHAHQHVYPLVGESHWRLMMVSPKSRAGMGTVYLWDPYGRWPSAGAAAQLYEALCAAGVEHRFHVHRLEMQLQLDGFQCGVWVAFMSNFFRHRYMADDTTPCLAEFCTLERIHAYVRELVGPPSTGHLDLRDRESNAQTAHRLRVYFRGHVSNPRTCGTPVGIPVLSTAGPPKSPPALTSADDASAVDDRVPMDAHPTDSSGAATHSDSQHGDGELEADQAVKVDPVHLLFRIEKGLNSKADPLFGCFMSMMAAAMFIVHTDDLIRVQEWLCEKRGFTKEEVKRVPRNYYLRDRRVRNRIPPPKVRACAATLCWCLPHPTCPRRSAGEGARGTGAGTKNVPRVQPVQGRGDGRRQARTHEAAAGSQLQAALASELRRVALEVLGHDNAAIPHGGRESLGAERPLLHPQLLHAALRQRSEGIRIRLVETLLVRPALRMAGPLVNRLKPPHSTHW
jgi:hypothetical protein